VKALADVGAPLHLVTRDELMTPGTIFQIGIDPVRIDLLTSVERGREDLIASKRAAGRPHDLRDIEALEQF
jgi:hypothetical protein